jgi:Bacterial Ig-like domain (group 1).
MPTRSVNLVATLRDEDGNPLAGKTIYFYYRVSGQTEWTSADSAVTGSDGVAVKTVALTVPQTYDFKAEFQGDEDYEASYAEVLNYRVKAKTTIVLTITPT